MSEGRARGKVILLGEHACVYGTPALAAGLERGARATATRVDGPSSLQLGGEVIPPDAASLDDRARAFAALLAAGNDVGGVRVEAASELPAGGGLGSSAAIGVAIARALGADEAGAMTRATAWEGVFHGNPSGIDVAVAARGGCVKYVRGQGCEPVVPARDLHLCVGWTGAGASTRAMVEGIAQLKRRKPDLVDRSIDGVGALVSNAIVAVQTGDLTGLGKLMDLNQMILAGLLVSTDVIEAMCAIARSAGALGAKLTGAGGGGSVIALAPSARIGADGLTEVDAAAACDRILAGWREGGFSGFATRVRAFTMAPSGLAS